MSYLPCQNPNCKSLGIAHPNCKCYGGMADGGEVSHFCDSKKAHKETCEYFAEGGETGLDTSPIPQEPAPPESNIVPADNLPDNLQQPEIVPKDNLPDELVSSNVVPVDNLPDDLLSTEQKYGGVGSQLGAAAEGFGQGYLGPVPTLVEKGLSKLGVPGLTDEDIAGRAAANPILHGAGEAAGLGTGLLTGTGEAALIGKAAELANIAKATTMGAKIGAGVLKGAIENGLFQASDETTKAMLGQGDPEAGVAGKLADAGANILLSSASGGALGGLGGAASGYLTKSGTEKAGTALHSWLAGIGETAKGIAPENSLARWSNEKAYDKGVDFLNSKLSNYVVGNVVGTAFAAKSVFDLARSFDEGDVEGGIKKAAYDALEGFGAKQAIKHLSGPVGGAILKAISNGEFEPRKLFQVIDYADQVNSGAQKINRGVANLFKVGSQQTINDLDLSKNRRKLDEWIENGGVDQEIGQDLYDQNMPTSPQGFAEGGHVEKLPQPEPMAISHNDAVATHYPQQNILLNAAKGRMSNYLKGLRPQQNQPKLAFDDAPDQREQKKSYNRALDIAAQPLSILNKIKNGTVEQEHVKHFKNLYPEIDNVLQRKLAEQITEHQLKGKKPPYHVRQGLSLLLGTPLSGDMLPQNIQAAQATFQMQKAALQQGQPVTKNKRNTSTLTKADENYLTGSQARIARQQKQ